MPSRGVVSPLRVAFAHVLGRGSIRPATVAAVDTHAHVGPARVHARAEKEVEKHHAAPDPLDPETRRCAQMAPPSFTPVPAAPVPAETEIAPRARVSMEELLPQLVKRIAWAGDKRRGSVQMELGSGPHAGTVITVHAVDGRVRVELAGDDTGALRRRLEEKGFNVER
jgi:hypothetical protein